VGELVALAKSKPSQMNYGSAGIGNVFHLGMEQFKQLTGSDFTHVPFRGLGPALVGILRNDVQVMVADFPLVLESIRSGKLRALAQTGSSRAPQLPDVPTFAEAGVANYEGVGFLGIWARTGTPPEALAALNREVNKALASPEFKTYSANGMLIAGGSPADFARFLENDRKVWGRVISTAGIKIE
jgi:tripartite-type tricarboxylate transporter receptor subunit TctC